MRGTRSFIVGATLFVTCISGFAIQPRLAMAQSQARTQSPAPAAASTAEEGHRWIQGAWQAPAGLKQTPIWPNRAPDMGGTAQASERVEIAETPDALDGTISEAAWDVSSPTMTVFPPKGINKGAAIIVFPGGGFRGVVLTKQGTEICGWVTSLGLTCVLSKYRVPGTRNHHWPAECPCYALQDAQRTIRVVRSRAAELHVDPGKIGVMGFSAGGFLAAQASNIFEPVYEPVDAIDATSSRPDFAIVFYPGHLCRPDGTLDAGIRVTSRTPPTFLLQAWDDPVDPVCNSTVYASALDAARVPTEVHLFARGGHAFGLRRAPHSVVSRWPALVESWLRETGTLAP